MTLYPEKAVLALGHGVEQERLHGRVKRELLSVRVRDELLFELRRRSDAFRQDTNTTDVKNIPGFFSLSLN